MLKFKKVHLWTLLISFVLLCGFVSIFLFRHVGYANQAPFNNPNSSLTMMQLIGSWQLNYVGSRQEVINLLENGECLQRFVQNGSSGKVLICSWWLEEFDDGRIRLHLTGARFFENIPFVDEHGFHKIPCPADESSCNEFFLEVPYSFYDPVSMESIHMLDELILNVRIDPFGEIIFMPMWIAGGDQGFPIFWIDSQIYRRVN